MTAVEAAGWSMALLDYQARTRDGVEAAGST